MRREIKLLVHHSNYLQMKNPATKKLCFALDREMLRILSLIALTIYAYHPFFSASNIGALDAQYYQYMLHDAIIQLENGFFPTYVGQSLFSPSGTPVIRGPFYLLLGQLLNTLSLGALSPLLIQHLTIFISALSAAISLYFIIRNIAPLLRWQAVFLAFAYVSSPGVMSPICYMDMYFTFMAAPFVPVAFYGLLRIHQKNDAIAYVLTGASLALAWMSHPPIALWTSILSLIYCLSLVIIAKRNPIRFIFLALLFLLLCLWQFFPILSLGIQEYTPYAAWNEWSADSPKWTQIVARLLAQLPDVFLPLNQGKNGLYFLQLGYSLWFLIILAAIMALRSSGTSMIRLMLTLIVCILLFLYPLTGISRLLWSIAPALVIDLSNVLPQARLYLILAATGCFVGALALQEVAASCRQKIKPLIAIALTGLFAWNIHEVSVMVKHTSDVKASNEAVMNPIDSWVSPNNINYIGFILPDKYLNDFFPGNHSPWLQARLLDSQKNPVSAYDNEQFVFNRCFAKSQANNDARFSFSENIGLPFEATLKEPLPIITKLNLLPNTHYLLCADISSSHGNVIFQIIDQQRREKAAIEIPENTANPLIRRTVGVPFYFTDQEKENKDLNGSLFDFRTWSQQQAIVKLYDVQVTSYEPANLPIAIKSYTPFRAEVTTKPDHKYIEIRKLFMPGYVAMVNGKESPIIESEHKSIIIPLNNSGLNKIELSYNGTPGLKTTFYISTVTWILVVTFLMTQMFSHIKQRYATHRQNRTQPSLI